MAVALVEDIVYIGNDSKLDACAKRLLSSKNILAYILHEVVDELKNFNVTEICLFIDGCIQNASLHYSQNEYIDGMNNEISIINEGKTFFDIRFSILIPETKDAYKKFLMDLELQNKNASYSILKRAFYYCGRMFSSQYGREFKKSQYNQLKKVYSIWIITHPKKENRNTVVQYETMKNNKIGYYHDNQDNEDMLSIILINLGSENEDHYVGVIKMLDVLFGKKDVKEKIRILQEEFDIQLTDQEKDEVEEMCNLSVGIREEGIKEGIQQSRLESITNLMSSLNLTMYQAMDALKIPENQRNELQQLLNM